MKTSRRLGALLISLVVIGLLASVSLAGPSPFGRSVESGHDVVVTDGNEGTDCDGTTDEGDGTTDEGDGTTDEGDGTECGAEDTDDGGGTDGGASEEAGDEPVDAVREAACRDAAGMQPSEDDTATDGEAKARGLDNAIEHVLANCVKNPQAPGLLNALERLAANRERHEEHEAWKAERKAEREAAKAEKRAGKEDRAQSHDGGGGPGNPHGGGSPGSHGSGHGQSIGGSHGNGH
jgi:hypothetical protein